jgi:hypothetical protein
MDRIVDSISTLKHHVSPEAFASLIPSKNEPASYYSCHYHTTTFTSHTNPFVPDLSLPHERAIPHLHLSGYAWVQELLNGHPEHIFTELGMHKEVFYALIKELQSMGHGNTRYVTLEEQLAIFLYTSVTGLTIHHVGE